MGTFADSLFAALMSWVRALVSSIWALFTSEDTTLLGFLGKNWLAIALVLIAAGLVVDWLIWLIRWQQYHLWALRIRRLLGIAAPDDADEDEEDAVRERYAEDWSEPQADEPEEDVRIYARPARERAAQQEAWLPLPGEEAGDARTLNEEEAQQAMNSAQSVPDEELGIYPGRRYDGDCAGQSADLGGTQRYAAVHAEGPGAAEVARRRAEIDAWQQQMQEEAKARAQAEKEAHEAEQARIAQEAYEAEQARIEQETYEAEQARMAQEEYERQLAEYERQKAQYERDLAEYERQKAEYDAQMAALNVVKEETAQEIVPQTASRRRRTRAYSDYVPAEAVSDLPDAPQWPKMQEMETRNETQEPKKENRLLSRVAHMIEPQEEEIARVTSLPPRVDMKSAYRPAKRPPKA